jgi:group I intron endonuclease
VIGVTEKSKMRCEASNTLRFSPRSITVPDHVYGVVYLARNKVNGHGYVGQSTEFKERRYGHLRDSKWCTYPIYLASEKYGWDSFEWIFLATAQTQKELDDQETKYIALYGYYNLREGGSRGKHSESTKAKLRAISLATPISEEAKANHLAAMQRKEVRDKLREKKLGELNPMKRPEVAAKNTALRKGVPRPHLAGKPNPLLAGDNNPAKRPEVRKKLSDNNPMKQPEIAARCIASRYKNLESKRNQAA